MLVRDIDRKLDMHLVLSYRVENDLFSIFRKYRGFAPAYGYSQGGKSFLDIFLREDENQHFNEMLKPFSISTRGSYSTIRIQSEQDESLLKFFEEVTGIYSLILNGIYVEGGDLFFEMRFHHNSLGEVSTSLKKLSRESENMKLRKLGPSPGIISILSSFNARFPLSVLSFEGKLPAIPSTRNLPIERITEPNLSFAEPDGHRIISYSSKPVQPGSSDSIISPEDGIVIGKGSTPFVYDLWKSSSDEHIPRYAAFGVPAGEKFVSSLFVPRHLADVQLRIMFEVADRHPESGFRLAAFTPFEEGIWDWL